MDVIDHKFVEFPFADYLLVFISIIVGYVCTEFFAGWGSLIRNRENVKMYWLHLAWTINFFCQLMVNWWWLWGNRIRLTENFLYFFYTLISPVIFYIISVFLFPTIKDGQVLDFKVYFYKNRNNIFGMFGMLISAYYVNNIWLRGQDIMSFDNIYCLTGIAFALISVAVKNELFHVVNFCIGSVIFATYAIFFNDYSFIK
ncbi:MAG: hypothetical protein NW207_06140 [Cytophagales bacterium]|nr:hypothetical protein [Cytophagales bacterium]